MIYFKTRKIQTTRKGWVRKLDKLISEIVILRDPRCVTCGSYNNPTCGHLFSQVAYNTRWNLQNTYRQCLSCNFLHEHDPYPFIEWARKNSGATVLNRLHQKYRTASHFKNRDLEEMFNQLTKIKEKMLRSTPRGARVKKT